MCVILSTLSFIATAMQQAKQNMPVQVN